MRGWLVFWVLVVSVGGAFAQAAPRGGLALQFDDGWTSWLTIIAPELARVGGKATGFVNNKYILNGRISKDDLRALQDQYGWEIGTHTWNHFNAPRYIRQHGLTNWLEQELDPALADLRDAGLNVRALVYPFNASTPELNQAVMGRVDSYRRADAIALAPGLRPDGSLPGTSIDSTRYAPLPLLYQWIDLAQRQNQVLFLYGHRVLPDADFITGRVVTVSGRTLSVDVPVRLQPGEEYVVVPDMVRRSAAAEPFVVTRAEDTTVEVDRDGLVSATAPGAAFMIGPAYGTRLSDFRALIEYAAPRVNFYTIADIVSGRHKDSAPVSPTP